VFFYPEAEQNLVQFTREGLAALPVCVAKTHMSLSADSSVLGAPEGFRLPVRDFRAYTGAGWLVALCGEITQMPGLGKAPAALGVDIDPAGRTLGLF
jgi:formate--tetrahydrofolate ligase